MKKNIILIDLELSLIESIFNSKKVNIEYLITDVNFSKLEEVKKLYDIKNILTREEFHNNKITNKIDIDYQTIENFKASQLNSAHWQDRLSDDYNLKQYRFFNALAFWIEVFKNKNISAIILDKLMHGANYDSLALDVAKFFGISAFVIDYHMERYVNNNITATRSVLDYNTNKRVSLNHSQFNLQHINIDNYLFYIDKIELGIKRKRKSIKEIIKNILPSYTSTVFHILVYVLRRQSIQRHGLNLSRSKIISNIFYISKMKRLYDSISVKFDYSKKYIFYALHFDPEAATMARARFSNQLMIIVQLSQNLPDGWVLYIKEHPDQFRLYQEGWWYFLSSIHKFRTKEFYEEINKLHNVKLLKYDVKSEEIIKSANAISTINGSIALEAIFHKKPLILFGHQSTPFGLSKDVFKIVSSKNCREAIDKIKKGFEPNYSDINEIINNYLFELPNVTSLEIRLLIEYLVCEYLNDLNN